MASKLRRAPDAPAGLPSPAVGVKSLAPINHMGLPQMIRIASFLAAALLATATAASATTIGFSQVGSESDWRTAFSADMKAEAKIRGIDLHFDDAKGSVDAQFAAVRRFIVERVDAIVIAPVVVAGWTPVLQEARAAHIPVFIADRSVDADPSLFVARVGNDTNLEGRLAASWLAQATRGRCAIVELQSTTGAAPTIGRRTGFATVIAQFPGMRIIRSESGDFTAERRPARDGGIHQNNWRAKRCLRGVGAQRRHAAWRDRDNEVSGPAPRQGYADNLGGWGQAYTTPCWPAMRMPPSRLSRTSESISSTWCKAICRASATTRNGY